MLILLWYLTVAFFYIFYRIFLTYAWVPKDYTFTIGAPALPNSFMQDWFCYIEPQHLYFLLYGAYAVFLRYQPGFMVSIVFTMFVKFLLQWEEGPGALAPDGSWYQFWPTPFLKDIRISYRNHLQVEFLPEVIFCAFFFYYFFDYQRYSPITILLSSSLVVATVFLMMVDDYIVHKTNYTFLWEVLKDKFFWALLLTILLVMYAAPKTGVVLFFLIVYSVQYFYILLFILILFSVYAVWTFFLIAIFQLAKDCL